MNFLPRIVTGVALLATSAAVAQTSSATLPSVPAYAKIYSAITATQVNGLDFGGFYSGTAGTVVLNPMTEARTTGLPVSTDPFTTAEITVGGKRNALFHVTLPASAVTLTNTATADTMQVTAFTGALGAKASALAVTGTDRLPNTAGATVALRIGATLTVAATQADGDYQGLFPVTVTYN